MCATRAPHTNFVVSTREAEMSVPVLCPHGAHSALTGVAFSSPRTAKNRACPPSHPMWEGVPQGPGGSGSTIANCVTHRWWCLGTILQPIPSPSHIRKLSSRGQVEVAEGQSVAGGTTLCEGSAAHQLVDHTFKTGGGRRVGRDRFLGRRAAYAMQQPRPPHHCTLRPPFPHPSPGRAVQATATGSHAHLRVRCCLPPVHPPSALAA